MVALVAVVEQPRQVSPEERLLADRVITVVLV
jgi:hypothetical protein